MVSAVGGAGSSPLHPLLGRLPPGPAALTGREAFAVTALAWSPDGSRLAVGTKAEVVHLWDVPVGERLWSANAFDKEVGSFQFHPTEGWLFGGAVITGGSGFRNAETGAPVLQMAGGLSGGFTADGRTLARGETNRVCFVDFRIPDAVRTLHGSASPSHHRAWSGDGRYLASLDRRFEVQVWDVLRSAPADRFRAPRGDGLSPENAAVALSDDGRYLAYASGGDERAWLVLRDVRGHVTVDAWPMRGGFERLGYSEGRFWLVREEDEGSGPYLPPPGPRRVRSVAYELEVGRAPRRLGVVRRSEPGDVRRFLDHALSADGRYYLWVGPRQPQRQRLEVWDVRAHRLLARKPCPAVFGGQSFPAYLDPHGRRFLMGLTSHSYRAYDLPDPAAHRTLGWASQVSGDGRWEVDCTWDNTPAYRLRHAGEEGGWLVLAHEQRRTTPKDVSFSPDSRYLAWPNRDGTLTLMDLPAVEARVREFEAGVSREKEGKR